MRQPLPRFAHRGTTHPVAAAEVMVSEVVPVWSRQMEVTGTVTTEGLGNILNVFSSMSDSLHTLTQNLASFEVKAEPGALDQSVRREAPALDALNTSASARPSPSATPRWLNSRAAPTP